MRKVNKDEAEYLFSIAAASGDRTARNYESLAWDEYISFYVIDDVCFGGVRRFDNGCARVLDRYFVFPDARSKSLKHSEHITLMLGQMVADAEEAGYKPFFSTEIHRAAAMIAAKTIGWHVLPEKHITRGNSKQWIIMRTTDGGFGKD